MKAIDPLTPGGRIRQRRLELGLGQVALAKKAGVPQSVVSDFETGKKQDIMASVFMAICRALGMSADFAWHGVASDWPFAHVSPQRFAEVPDMARHLAEQMLLSALETSAPTKRRASGS